MEIMSPWKRGSNRISTLEVVIYMMKMFLFFILFFSVVSCQHMKRLAECRELKNPPDSCFIEKPEKLPVLSHKEDSSQEVKKHLDEPYVSSYGEIQLDDNEQVEKWIHYFQTAGQERMATYLSRSSRYIPMMKNVFREYQLPEDLVYVAMIESGFSPHAHSFANAVGYWQFIEETGKRYGLKVNSYVDERRDPVLSTRAAAEYFKNLYNVFTSWHMALASYNTGEYRVMRAVMRYYTKDFWYLSSKRSLPRETLNYVPKFIAALRISKDPKKYGFDGIEYQTPLEYDTVKLNFPVSLKKIASKMGVEYKEIQKLNPRYRGEYVPIEQTEETVLRIPVGKKETIVSVLAECRMDKPKFMYSDHYWYRIRRGDTLYRLARRNKTTISTIRRMNKMSPRRTMLRAGRRIKLPYYNRAIKRNRKYAIADSHVVKKGESLTSIAKQYRVKVGKLRDINKLTSASSIIHPGQVLRLVENNKKRAPAGNKQTSSKTVHTVKRGETLIGIAKKYNVSLPLLMKKNSLNFKSTLIAGKRIIIPQ